MSHDSEREPSTFETRTRALFEESVASLDGRTRSRLNQARQAALAVARASRAPLACEHGCLWRGQPQSRRLRYG